MKTISVAVMKGGAGKTTTAATLSQYAIKQGYRVLCVDLDPQGNFTTSTAAEPYNPGAFELLTGSVTPSEAVQITTQGLSVIAANRNLTTIQTTNGSGNRLKEALKALETNYDYCFIDTPPMLGELVFNALIASDGLVIPLETDDNSLQGLYHLADLTAQINKSSSNIKILGALLTRYDGRPKINKFYRKTIETQCNALGFPILAEIRNGIACREARALQVNIYDYAPKSKPAQDYIKLFESIKQML